MLLVSYPSSGEEAEDAHKIVLNDEVKKKKKKIKESGKKNQLGERTGKQGKSKGDNPPPLPHLLGVGDN